MPPLRVAVIGAGAFGRNHLRVYRELQAAHPELVELAAVVDSNLTLLAEAAARYNIPAFASVAGLLAAPLSDPHPTRPDPDPPSTVDAPFIAQPLARWVGPAGASTPGAPGPDSRTRVDAASICVPTLRHASVAEPLLRAGLDLLIEKPFAASLEEADHLLTLAAQLHRILAIGHLERFNPAVTAVAERLNRPMFFEAHRLSIFTPRSLDVDVVLDLMIHDLDIVLSLSNSPVREVRAVGLPILSHKVDIANVRIEFASGCVANFTASRVSTEQVRKLRLFQPHQYLSLDFARQELLSIDVAPLAASLLAAARPSSLDPASLSSRPEAAHFAAVVERSAVPPSAAPTHPSAGLNLQKLDLPRIEPLRLELENFLEAVRTRTPPRVTAEAGRSALALALEINREIAAHAHRAGLA